MIYDNVILTDCDGVLVDWLKSFVIWMAKHGHHPVTTEPTYDINVMYGITKKQKAEYIKMFHVSAYVGFLNPLRDAMYYVDLLHRKHGYVFHLITSMSDDPMAKKLRIQNIENLFGKTAFERFTILGAGEDKTEALREYKDSGCWWIEDKPSNAEVPLENDFDIYSILMKHAHNENYLSDRYSKINGWKVKTVDNWNQIYNLITGE